MPVYIILARMLSDHIYIRLLFFSSNGHGFRCTYAYRKYARAAVPSIPGNTVNLTKRSTTRICPSVRLGYCWRLGDEIVLLHNDHLGHSRYLFHDFGLLDSGPLAWLRYTT